MKSYWSHFKRERSGSNDSSIYSLDKVNIPKVVQEKINLKIESNGGE